jgi:transposase
VPDRACLTGIVFVLQTGIQWQYLPQEMGCGSGTTCWRRLRAWQRAGVWDRLHRVLLQRLVDAGRIDWSRASADAARAPAKGGRRDGGRTRSTAARRRDPTPAPAHGGAGPKLTSNDESRLLALINKATS